MRLRTAPVQPCGRLERSRSAPDRDVEAELGRAGRLARGAASNALNWFKDAQTNNVTDFDIIGLSYYSKWSTYALGDLHRAIDSLKTTYKKEIVIVETAYPHTLENIDAAGNILGEDAIIPNFPATPQGQKNYLIKLTNEVLKAGGLGVIYWEPAWVTSSSSTLWGTGSHWDNATFFDAFNSNEALPAFDFFNKENYKYAEKE